MSFPAQTIPANERLIFAVVADLDPASGLTGLMEGDLNDGTPASWTLQSQPGQPAEYILAEMGGVCGNAASCELYGPAGVPTVSAWSVVVMTLGLLAVGTITFRRVRRPALG